MKLHQFYIAIFTPWILGIYFFYMHYNLLFAGFVIAYCIYRCILDYHKLKRQGVVGKKDIWQFIVPGHSVVYFQELYFKS